MEKQIQAQQQAIMQVQTASAKAKWEQEVIKAKMVTEAQQKLEVARLEALTAEQYKIKKIKEAEADAEYKRRIIVADGALSQELEAWKEVNGMYAKAIKKIKKSLSGY